MMNNAEVAQTFVEAINAHDIDRAAGWLSDDFQAVGTAVKLGKEQMLAYLGVLFEAFPDISFDISDTQEEGDTVYFTFHERGTHTGLFDLNAFGLPVNLPATNKTFSCPEEKFEFRLRDGKITYMQQHSPEGGGLRGVLAQLGVDI